MISNVDETVNTEIQNPLIFLLSELTRFFNSLSLVLTAIG